MIKFGIKIQEGFDYETHRLIAQESERLGFDSVWRFDHMHPVLHYTPSLYAPILECWTTLSALASETEKIKLGTMVLCNAFRTPSVLAKMSATLDVISGGRLELGLGAGWLESEYNAYGLPWERSSVRIGKLREATLIIKKMWTEKDATFDGRYYKIEGAINQPKPIQKPHPPIWIGGKGNRMLKVVAEVADGYNLNHMTLEESEEKIETLNKNCVKICRDPVEIKKSWQGSLIIAETQGEVKEKLQGVMAHHPREEVRAMDPKEFSKSHIVGTPEECIKQIDAFINLGINYFIFICPEVANLKSMNIFSETVQPSF